MREIVIDTETTGLDPKTQSQIQALLFQILWQTKNALIHEPKLIHPKLQGKK